MAPSGDEQFAADDWPASAAFDSVFEIKVHPPAARAEWIERPRLLRQLTSALASPVVLVAAPAGYGKSTLVTQWVSSGPACAVAWVTLDPADNDPTRLWTHLAAALDRIGQPVEENMAGFIARNSTTIAQRVVPRVVAALAAFDQPIAIVLEDCHVLRSAQCCDQLDRLIDHLPGNAHLVLVSRSDPNLRLGRLRVAGELAEVRTAELAFTTQETAAVLDAEGVCLSADALRELVQRTEGWPAAVYLAALTLVGRQDSDAFVADLSGSDRFIADYLSEEVLGRQSVELRDFVLSLSVFDRFNVALANHVMQTRTSLRMVRELEHTNQFLVPLHGGGWFRFHHLFASFARSALEMTHPGAVGELHRRGAQWFVAHDRLEEAVRHLLAAGDFDDAATLVQANWVRFFDAGRSATVVGWLAALRGTSADRSPAATVAGAWMSALTGDRPEMLRRLAVLEAMTDDQPLPDGTRSPQSALVLIRGLFGFDGPDRMLTDSRRAVELETDSSTPWYAVARAALGHAAFVVGDIPLARPTLAEAARASAAPTTIRLLALGTLALCEAEQGQIGVSARLADQAMQIIAENSMSTTPQVTFAYTAYGVKLASEGRWSAAVAALDEGLQARRQVPGLSPWPLIHHLMVMAVIASRSGNREAAENLLSELDELTPWDDESMARTRSRIAEARRLTMRPAPELPRRGEPLTPRELEILQRLQGSQTLREIASDLYVSHNTVKTITLSVYRKLGAHSRAEAVALIREHNQAPRV